MLITDFTHSADSRLRPIASNSLPD
jgi:hypothetical protein